MTNNTYFATGLTYYRNTKSPLEDKRKYLTADDGKLIYSALSPMEEQVGVHNICIPIEWDENIMFKEIADTDVPY